MTCEERQELFELYSLGALEQAEQLDLEEHLARGCGVCERNFKEAVAMNAVFSQTIPDAAREDCMAKPANTPANAARLRAGIGRAGRSARNISLASRGAFSSSSHRFGSIIFLPPREVPPH